MEEIDNQNKILLQDQFSKSFFLPCSYFFAELGKHDDTTAMTGRGSLKQCEFGQGKHASFNEGAKIPFS